VADAGKLTVVEGDYFGTGKLPPREAGDFIVAHSWTVMPLGELSSEYKCESEFGDHISTQPFRCIDDALSASHPSQVS